MGKIGQILGAPYSRYVCPDAQDVIKYYPNNPKMTYPPATPAPDINIDMPNIDTDIANDGAGDDTGDANTNPSGNIDESHIEESGD